MEKKPSIKVPRMHDAARKGNFALPGEQLQEKPATCGEKLL